MAAEGGRAKPAVQSRMENFRKMELKGRRQIVFSGCGRAVTKTITCVEIMKRKLGGLHQVTKVRYKTVLEVWENQDPLPNGPAQNLTVHKNVPSICILLSRDPLDPSQTGYQPPEPRHEAGENTSGSSTKGLKRPLPPPCEELLPKKLQVQVSDSPRGLGTTTGQLDH
ncbi:ribonuclease P protein subunit p25 isoform X2 [Parus major]|uniref:ribonuclease P protein subunit p25 isoform X2 n=1 Tax=Parus major TaxID=9157 RepID=UPI001444898F|nr:ribonuclease P protein subunit p25 isoform X2 [Parus major]